MINSKELRIGNWISSYAFINDGAGKMYESEIRKVQVDADLIKFIDSEKFATYNQIPLTPEILEKVGFNHRDSMCNHFSLTSDSGEIVFEEEENTFYVFSGLGSSDSYGFKTECKYLHQLQNLVFALTGKDISYTP